jgi:hypothetical protein
MFIAAEGPAENLGGGGMIGRPGERVRKWVVLGAFQFDLSGCCSKQLQTSEAQIKRGKIRRKDSNR